MSDKIYGDKVDKCLRISSNVSCSAVKIYNLIREVGYGKLSADNALHQMVEEYHRLNVISEEISKLADILDKE